MGPNDIQPFYNKICLVNIAGKSLIGALFVVDTRHVIDREFSKLSFQSFTVYFVKLLTGHIMMAIEMMDNRVLPAIELI